MVPRLGQSVNPPRETCGGVHLGANFITSALRARIADMAGRPRTPEGEKIRDTILVYLRRLELANAPKPTGEEISSLISRSRPTAIEHLGILRQDGMVTWQPNQVRTLTLTDKGRQKANELLASSPSPDVV